MSPDLLGTRPFGAYGCSFAVITVVKEAHDHFRELVDDYEVVTSADGRHWTQAVLKSSDGGTHTVIEGQLPQRSHLLAQEFATLMLNNWAPRCLVIADCGGGIHSERTARKELKLGDVIVSELLHYYELQKLRPRRGDGSGDRVPLYIQWQPVSPWLSSTARDLDSIAPTWRRPLRAPRPSGDGRSEILQGELVCGDKLLDDPDANEVEGIVRTYERALAVDMETVGVARAALAAADRGLALSFVALRGISDWVNRAEGQTTRDTWKSASCEAAVAAAIALIGVTPAIAAGGSEAEVVSRKQLHERLATMYAVPDSPFEAVIQVDGRALTRNDVLAFAAAAGGAVLIGDGGIGKSSVLQHAVLGAMSPLDPFPVLVDLKRWRPEYDRNLAADPTGSELETSLDTLLRASVQRIGVKTLEEIAEVRPVILFVDGLNEVPYAETGRPILTLLNEYMRMRPNASALVTDRTGSEFYADNGWQMMRLQPLDTDEVYRVVEEILGADAAQEARGENLLRIPFFLDRALRGGNPAQASRAKALEDFFVRHALIEGNALDQLAEAAFDVYAQQRRRTFSAAAISSKCGTETLSALRQAGVVIEGEAGELAFEHQLEHDFLAAKRLSSEQSLWQPSAFDALTFEAANFDVLGLALEQIAEQDDRDAFLRHLYDWNWRGTVTALGAAEQSGSAIASPSLRTALLAVIAEKKFDLVAGTSERSARELERFGGEEPAAMAAAASLAELTVIATRDRTGPKWFEEWAHLFSRLPDGSPLTREELSQVGNPDPVIGWTATNVARRFRGRSETCAQIRAEFAAQTGESPIARAVRWRAVHVLGAWPSQENAETLITAIGDEYMWVEFGAVRSLTEMAASTRDVDLRDWILAELGQRLEEIQPEPLSQIAFTSRYIGAPHAYGGAVRPLLRQILAAQTNDSDSRLWTARLERFEAFWKAAADA